MDGASNLFFACHMRPKSFDMQYLASEISEVIWMPLEEYKKIAALETPGNDYVGYGGPDFHGAGGKRMSIMRGLGRLFGSYTTRGLKCIILDRVWYIKVGVIDGLLNNFL